MIRATIIACLALASSAIPLRLGSYLGQQDVPNPAATIIRATIRAGNVMDFRWDFNMYRMTASWDCRDVPFADYSDRIEINPTATPCVAQIPAFFSRFFTLEGNLVMRKTDENTLHLVTGLMDCVNVFLRSTGGAAPTTTTPTTTTATTTTTTLRRSTASSGAVTSATTATTATTTRRPDPRSGSTTSTSTVGSGSSSTTSTTSAAPTGTTVTTATTTMSSTTLASSNSTTSVAPVNSTTTAGTTAVPTNATTPSPRINNSTTTTTNSASVAGSLMATVMGLAIVFAL